MLPPSDFGEVTPSAAQEPGLVDGRHYTEHCQTVRDLMKAGKLETAEDLLLRLVEAVEAESVDTGWGAAPWYYERLAVIYRKRKDFGSECTFGAEVVCLC